jgi:hypothetical protein
LTAEIREFSILNSTMSSQGCSAGGSRNGRQASYRRRRSSIGEAISGWPAGLANALARQAKPNVLGTLAGAYAEAGRLAEAAATAERAVALAEQAGLQALADQTRARLKLYQAGQSCVDGPATNGPASPPEL